MFESLMNLWLIMFCEALEKVGIDKKNFKFTYELMAFVLNHYKNSLTTRTEEFRRSTGTSKEIINAINLLQKEGLIDSVDIQKPIGLKEALDLVKVLDCAARIHSPEAVLLYLKKMDKIH